MPVLGKTILVTAADIEERKKTPIEVKWRQGLADVAETYIQTTFICIGRLDTLAEGGKTGAESKGAIYIQLNKLEGLRSKKVAEQPDFTIVLDKDFQYGQKSKDGTGRWFVFHDKQHKPFRHRFLAATMQATLGQLASTSPNCWVHQW
ncbi:hypothetical protein BDV98DRAFT_593620 [Pterulicium gracile]|uniref:Uncharacterized protein n=1 Tax=Pterulicium gracile TaxID=1884261 RepID=A0A5C3QF91_9AGAR|nr:hypothetical protein BDV98DRAFT_593620 [Pterula gracilis]